MPQWCGFVRFGAVGVALVAPCWGGAFFAHFWFLVWGPLGFSARSVCASAGVSGFFLCSHFLGGHFDDTLSSGGARSLTILSRGTQLDELDARFLWSVYILIHHYAVEIKQTKRETSGHTAH